MGKKLKRLLEIVVHRRGYKRRAYTYRRNGKLIHVKATRVKPTTYKAKDRGKPGKTPKSRQWFHPKRKLKVGNREWKASHKATYRFGQKAWICNCCQRTQCIEKCNNR